MKIVHAPMNGKIRTAVTHTFAAVPAIYLLATACDSDIHQLLLHKNSQNHSGYYRRFTDPFLSLPKTLARFPLHARCFIAFTLPYCLIMQ
jgi:hypothetical protein